MVNRDNFSRKKKNLESPYIGFGSYTDDFRISNLFGQPYAGRKDIAEKEIRRGKKEKREMSHTRLPVGGFG